ncbi:MAG: hypothetical protein D6714_01165 [Bacteroidetes bacterium]|nr:MAG: hypothetical protein D6714_01165 [Bacteroidota bacterium]
MENFRDLCRPRKKNFSGKGNDKTGGAVQPDSNFWASTLGSLPGREVKSFFDLKTQFFSCEKHDSTYF